MSIQRAPVRIDHEQPIEAGKLELRGADMSKLVVYNRSTVQEQRR
jgi:hypothetical protein